MSNNLQRLKTLKIQITKLKEINKKYLKKKKFSALSFDKQLDFCHNNKALGQIYYEASNLLVKEKHPNQAAAYFYFSYEIGYEKALNEMRNARKKESDSALKEKKIIGSPEGIFTRGLRYLLGFGKKQNPARANLFFRKAATLKHAAAQYNLGRVYDDGIAVVLNKKKAFKWYRLAAKKGYASAQNTLGWMYDHGEGVDQDKKKAVKWYRLAAEQGHAKAQCGLGWMYDEGQGVATDKKEAVKWYRLSAEQGNEIAQCNLGSMYDKGQGVTTDKKEAVKWYRLAAEQGYARAQCNLGWMYQYGEGIATDKKEALKWYRLAAEQGYTKAQHNLTKLKDKQHLVAAYHLAMMEADALNIKRLMNKHPSLINVLLWDFNRSKDNETLHNSVLSVINPLLDNPQFIKSSGADGVQFVIQFLSSQIENLRLDPEHLLLLNELSISDMDEKGCHDLLSLVSDIWYYPNPNLKEKRKATIMAGLIEKTFYRLKSLNSSIKDRHLLRQCALMLVRNAYGSTYEVSFTNLPDFNQLLAFIAIHNVNPKMPYDIMNSLLKIELIKPVSMTKWVQYLNQLTDYLKIKEVTKGSITLEHLKERLSKNWEAVKKPSENTVRQVLSDICQQSKKALEISKKYPHSFLSVETEHAKKLFSLLAEERFDDLIEITKPKPLNSSNNKIFKFDNG